MKLSSMKIDKKALKEKMYPAPSMGEDRPAYPYGLEVRLDTESLKKLGLLDKLPKVGASLKLEASVDVTSCSENESAGGGKSCSVSLQITELGLGPASKDVADRLYEKK